MKTDRLYLVTGAAGFLGSTVCRQQEKKAKKTGKQPLMTTFEESLHALARCTMTRQGNLCCSILYILTREKRVHYREANKI